MRPKYHNSQNWRSLLEDRLLMRSPKNHDSQELRSLLEDRLLMRSGLTEHTIWSNFPNDIF